NLGGTSYTQLSNLEFARSRSGNLRPLYGVRPWTRKNALSFTGVKLSKRWSNPLAVSCTPSSDTTASDLEVGLEAKEPVAIKTQIIPTSFEVESLVSEICETASVAEFELKFNGFRLYVTRNLTGKTTQSPPSTSPSDNTSIVAQAPASNGSVSGHSLAISKSTPSGENRTLLEKATDEGLVVLNSPRVGFFRRSRTIKGKRAPPPCKENQSVKEGQVLCYIEQLGGEIPIESDVAGEVVKILRRDGEPVGYGDALMKILPSFPGIKKLQ
ncbi:Single hybrid motif superfamily protein, partial [Thalictrum thalictroides]